MPSVSDPGRFEVRTSTGSYAVVLGDGVLDSLAAQPGDRVYIVDACLSDRLARHGIDPIAIVADEPAKSLDRMTEVIVALRDRGATRGTTLVAVGGGVIQDIAAFAASVYMRGIDWIYAPSTLLSMADSCIGGKSSINVGRYKNIVGTIHPPREVLIEPALTATLSREQKAAGLCEAAKISLCRGADAFAAYDSLAPTAGADAAELLAIIDHSLRTKRWFIEIDEFDRAERLLLNFGHTFGHALEAATGFGITHGIAVGLGMQVAFALGEALGRDYGASPHLARFRAHVAALVAEADGIDAALAGVSGARLLDAFASDKKHARDRFAVVLPTADGTVERMMLPRDAAGDAAIACAFRTGLALDGRRAA